jgi:hypothetical protein
MSASFGAATQYLTACWFFFLSAKDIMTAIIGVANLLVIFDAGACLEGGPIVEMENGAVLNLLGSDPRTQAPAEAELAAIQPSLCMRMARNRWRHLLLQGSQSGRIRATTGNRR